MSHSGGYDRGPPNDQHVNMTTNTNHGHDRGSRGGFGAREGNGRFDDKSINNQSNDRESTPTVSGSNFRKRRYLKDATVKIHDIDNVQIGAMAVISTAEDICGKNTVLAVVPDKDLKNSYEITMDGIQNAWKLTNGFKIGEKEYECTLAASASVIVSFMYIPAYIEDEDLLRKLREKNIEILSPVYRKTYQLTQVANGTRCVRVKFPPGIRSLAWSMAFETSYGRRYFKVVHDNQIKVCSGCYSPGHIYRECPEFRCLGCGEQGHGKRDCKASMCGRCRLLPLLCKCEKNRERRNDNMDNDKDDLPETQTQTVSEGRSSDVDRCEKEKNSECRNDNMENDEKDPRDTHTQTVFEGRSSDAGRGERAENLDDEIDDNDEMGETENEEDDKTEESEEDMFSCNDCKPNKCNCVCGYCQKWMRECICDELHARRAFKRKMEHTIEEQGIQNEVQTDNINETDGTTGVVVESGTGGVDVESDTRGVGVAIDELVTEPSTYHDTKDEDTNGSVDMDRSDGGTNDEVTPVCDKGITNGSENEVDSEESVNCKKKRKKSKKNNKNKNKEGKSRSRSPHRKN